MSRSFLDAIGVDMNIDTDEAQKAKFAEDENKYGFPSYETWNLDYTMVALLYERLMLFNKVNIIDTTNESGNGSIIDHNGKKLTIQDAIDLMIECAEEVLTAQDSDYLEKLHEERFGKSQFYFKDSSVKYLVDLVEDSPLDEETKLWYEKRILAVEQDAHLAEQELWTVWSKVFPYMWW